MLRCGRVVISGAGSKWTTHKRCYGRSSNIFNQQQPHHKHDGDEPKTTMVEFSKKAGRDAINQMIQVLLILAIAEGIKQLLKKPEAKDVYSGDLDDNNQMHGQGIMKHSNGDVYEGEFSFGQRQNHGKYTFASGDVYIGHFDNNLRDGYGTMTYKDDSVYSGEWKDDIRTGNGLFTDATGNVYQGTWETNGEITGATTPFSQKVRTTLSKDFLTGKQGKLNTLIDKTTTTDDDNPSLFQQNAFMSDHKSINSSDTYGSGRFVNSNEDRGQDRYQDSDTFSSDFGNTEKKH